MTFEKFLKIHEINLPTLSKILEECAKYNKSLKYFLQNNSYTKVPAHTARKFIKSYEMSTINIRTGDIVIPAQNLSSIKVKHFNKIKTWLYYSQQSEKSPVPLNVKFYAIILDKDDKYLNHCSVEKLDEDGFSFTPVGMMVNKSGSKFYCEMNQTVEINLDEVSKDVEKILLCAFVDDPKFDPEKYCFSTFKCISKTFSDQTLEKEIAELPIDSWFKINTSGAIIAFNIERYINQWIITMVNDSIDVNIDTFLKKFQ